MPLAYLSPRSAAAAPSKLQGDAVKGEAEQSRAQLFPSCLLWHRADVQFGLFGVTQLNSHSGHTEAEEVL